MSVIYELADELANATLEAEEEFNDDKLVDEVAGVLLAQSQTMQEAFMTAIRVRRSARAGRAYLERRIAAARKGEDAPTPPTADAPEL